MDNITGLQSAAAATRKRRKSARLYYDMERGRAVVDWQPYRAYSDNDPDLMYICDASRPMTEAAIADTIAYTLDRYEYLRRYR